MLMVDYGEQEERKGWVRMLILLRTPHLDTSYIIQSNVTLTLC
jgi:hypothetical protein